MNSVERNETIGVLEALAVAVQDHSTWYRVACWNGAQEIPYAAVADLLNRLKPVSQDQEGADHADR
jgi:hypothetical protein